MNLFILSLCFRECAEALFDKHVSKILLEAVQMLCTAKRILHPDHNDEEFRLYKIAHKNHPVTVWMRQSYENYCWTLQLVEAMHEEWKYRYNHPAEKQHKSFVVALYLKEHAPQPHEFPQQGLTPFALAMPEEYKSADPVASYRLYYQSQEKQKIASWKNREKPDWYNRYDASTTVGQ